MKLYLVYGAISPEDLDLDGAAGVYHYGIFSTKDEALRIAANLRGGIQASNSSGTIFVALFELDTVTRVYYDTMELFAQDCELLRALDYLTHSHEGTNGTSQK